MRADPDQIHLVRQVAEAEGISPAGALDRLLFDGLQRFAEGEIDTVTVRIGPVVCSDRETPKSQSKESQDPPTGSVHWLWIDPGSLAITRAKTTWLPI